MNITVLSAEELESFLKKELQPLREQLDALVAEIKLLKKEDKRLTRAKAADFLGLTYAELRTISYERGHEKRSRNQKIPFDRVGRNCLFNVEELINFKRRCSSAAAD